MGGVVERRSRDVPGVNHTPCREKSQTSRRRQKHGGSTRYYTRPASSVGVYDQITGLEEKSSEGET